MTNLRQRITLTIAMSFVAPLICGCSESGSGAAAGAARPAAGASGAATVSGQGRLASDDGRSAAGAVARGRELLWSHQMADGSWPNNPESFPGGPTALAAWALLESGVSPDDARLAKALAWLETLKTDKTYTISIRANVWAAASRQSSGLIASASPPSGSIASASPPSGKYDKLLERDVARLYHNTCGSYSYDIKAETICDIGDQSNGHYAVLGVEAGVGRKIEIPKEYWRTVERYWLSVQNPDGGWPYSRQGTPSSATMTAAGVCAMQLCNNQLQDAASASAIQKGLGWMDKNFRQSIKDPSMMYYYFLAVQRMGWLTGKSEIGGVKWAPAMEQELLSRQNKDGSWVGPWGTDVSTAYAILVLGRHP